MARQDLKSVAYAPMYLQWKTYVVFLLLLYIVYSTWLFQPYMACSRAFSSQGENSCLL